MASIIERLPPELRNRVYRLTLTQTGPIATLGKQRLEEPALLAVNRQIRNEAIALYYHENDFELVLGVDEHVRLQPNGSLMWFRSLGAIRCSYIKSLRVTSDQFEGEADSSHRAMYCDVGFLLATFDMLLPIGSDAQKTSGICASFLLRDILGYGIQRKAISIVPEPIVQTVNGVILIRRLLYLHYALEKRCECRAGVIPNPSEEKWEGVHDSYVVEKLERGEGLKVTFKKVPTS